MLDFINSHINEFKADERKLGSYIQSFVNYINGVSGNPEFYILTTGETSVSIFRKYRHIPIVDIDFYMYSSKKEEEPYSTLRLNLSTNQKDIASITIKDEWYYNIVTPKRAFQVLRKPDSLNNTILNIALFLAGYYESLLTTVCSLVLASRGLNQKEIFFENNLPHKKVIGYRIEVMYLNEPSAKYFDVGLEVAGSLLNRIKVNSPVPCIPMVLANKEYVNALDSNKDIKEISSQKVLKAILKSVTI